jgi:hypothetical protein
MHGLFDKLAKRITQKAVAPACASASEHEVHQDGLRADLLVEPHPARVHLLAPLGQLGRICRRICVLEFFHGTPGPRRFEPCVIKILALRRERRSDNDKRRRALRDLRSGARPLPVQCILTSGRPRGILERFGFQRAPGWGRGVYRAPRQLATHLVVASELPVTRDTMLVRLIAGKDRVQKQAMEELLALPHDAPERRVAGPIMVKLWPQVERRRARRSKEAEEYRAMFKSVQDLWPDELEEEAKERGRSAGMAEGIERSILDAYEARFGPVPKDIAARVAAARDAEVLRAWHRVAVTGSAADVAAAVRLRAPARRARRAKAPARALRG